MGTSLRLARQAACTCYEVSKSTQKVSSKTMTPKVQIHLELTDEQALALAQLIKQPRILHGNDSLRGKVFKQPNLLVRKSPDLLTVDGDHSDSTVILEQRYCEDRTNAPEFDKGL